MSAHPHDIDAAIAGEDAHLAEQFRNADQQREVATLGMWTFLATEILFFGGLFVAYSIYRIRWPEDFRHGSMDLKWLLGAINTGVLLVSSYFMALAVRAAQVGDNHKVISRLLWTMILAVVFLGIKFTEYYIEYDEHLIPGHSFAIDPPPESSESFITRAVDSVQKHIDRAFHAPIANTPRTGREQLFMCFYFIMTAIHATHMVIGIGLMAWLMWMARRRKFSAAWHNPVEIVGLYWHFVDTVWVFLFPILYLLRNP